MPRAARVTATLVPAPTAEETAERYFNLLVEKIGGKKNAIPHVEVTIFRVVLDPEKSDELGPCANIRALMPYGGHEMDAQRAAIKQFLHKCKQELENYPKRGRLIKALVASGACKAVLQCVDNGNGNNRRTIVANELRNLADLVSIRL